MRSNRTIVATLAALFALARPACANVVVVTMGSLPNELYPVFGVGEDVSERQAYVKALQDCADNKGINCSFATQTTEKGVSQTVIAGVQWGQLKSFVGRNHDEASWECRRTWARCYDDKLRDTWARATAKRNPPAIMDAENGFPAPYVPSIPLSGNTGGIFVAGLASFSPDNIPLGVGRTEQAAQSACQAQTPGGKQPCKLLNDPVDPSSSCVMVGIFKMPNGMFEPHPGATREQAAANAGPGATLIRYKGPLCS